MGFNKRNVNLIKEIEIDIDAVLDYGTDNQVEQLIESLKVALDNAIAESKKRRKLNQDLDELD